MKKTSKTPHQITKMELGKGRCHHGGSSITGAFKCPTCGNARWFNLNWLGHGGRILCNGLKTAVLFAGAENNWDEKALFAPTKKQLEKAAKQERYQAQFEKTGAVCTPGHEDHCMDAAKGSECDCGCGGANHAANAPAISSATEQMSRTTNRNYLSAAIHAADRRHRRSYWPAPGLSKAKVSDAKLYELFDQSRSVKSKTHDQYEKLRGEMIRRGFIIPA